MSARQQNPAQIAKGTQPLGRFPTFSGGSWRCLSELGLLARTLFLASILGAAVVPAAAQSAPGVILGIVSGSGGEPLSDIVLELTGGRPRRLLVSNVTTDPKGRFQFVGVPSDNYTLEAKNSDGRVMMRRNVEIQTGDTLELNLVLSPVTGAASSPTSQSRVTVLNVSWGARFGAFSLNKLPNTRNVWSLLESQEASTVTDRLDVGGLRTGEPALFGALGDSWTENQYALKGFNLTKRKTQV